MDKQARPATPEELAAFLEREYPGKFPALVKAWTTGTARTAPTSATETGAVLSGK